MCCISNKNTIGLFKFELWKRAWHYVLEKFYCYKYAIEPYPDASKNLSIILAKYLCLNCQDFLSLEDGLQYIPRNMHTVFALLCFVVVIHWLIFPYPSGLLHWHCGNLTIAPVPAKQPWWIWINTSCEFIMNDCITTTKQSKQQNRVHISWDILYGMFWYWQQSMVRFWRFC